MGNAGHDGIYFQRELDGAIERRDLNRIRMCVPTVERLALGTKARILDVLLEQRDDLYDKAAGRFLRDYLAEREPGLSEVDQLVNLLDPLLFSLDGLLELTDPTRRRST